MRIPASAGAPEARPRLGGDPVARFLQGQALAERADRLVGVGRRHDRGQHRVAEAAEGDRAPRVRVIGAAIGAGTDRQGEESDGADHRRGGPAHGPAGTSATAIRAFPKGLHSNPDPTTP